MTNDEVFQQTKHLIGTRYVAAVKPYISELTGRNLVVASGDIVTLNIDSSRVTVERDGDDTITGISFG